MNKITKKILSLALSLSLTLTSLNFVSNSEVLAKTQLMTPLVINEIVPDTDNVDGSDAYEFFEIQNVSNKDINLDDYNIVYNNDANWSLNDRGIVLSAGENLVVWIINDKNTSLTADDFNKYYGTELVQGKNLTTVSSGGFHNSKQRDLSIITKTGDVLSIVRYNEGDIKKVEKDNGINFRYLSKGQLAENLGYTTKASPGVTNDDQKYENPYQFSENKDGSIVVEGAKTKLPFNESFEVLIAQDYTNLPLSVTLQVKPEGEDTIKNYPANIDAEGKFHVSVPFVDLTNYKSFDWKVIVKTDSNQYESETKTTNIQDGELDRSKFPPFVVSELIPDTDNVGGADAYEFVEVTNNSKVTQNFKDFDLLYNYPEDGDDNSVSWFSPTEDLFVKPGESFVIWIDNGSNSSLTVEDFNNYYGTSLVENQNIFIVEQGGMANGSARGMRINSKAGDYIDYVLYNTDGKNVKTNRSITYGLNTEDSLRYILSDDADPTPGYVPEDLVIEHYDIEVAKNKPNLSNLTAEEYDENEGIDFKLEASSDETTIKRVTLVYKNNVDQNEQAYNVLRDEEGKNTFTYHLVSEDTKNKEYYSYYFIVSDGFNEVRTKESKIVNTKGEKAELRYNHDNNQVISGKDVVSTTGDTLFMDGQDITSKTRPALEDDAKIVFEASQTDTFFKNAVAIGTDILGIFDDGTYGDWKTYTYNVDLSYAKKGEVLQIDIHAGNKSNALVHDVENNDDFVTRNIRLVLPDGRIIRPEGFENPVEIIKMGDSVGKIEILEAKFTIPEESFNSIAYEFDSTEFEDGSHKFSSRLNETEKELELVFDNSGPKVTTNLENGKEYKNLNLEVEISDPHEVVKQEIRLDGDRIEVPYEISSLELEAGEHVLTIKAVDSLGNETNEEIKFTTPVENPSIEVISPKDKAKVKNDFEFEVKVQDPTDDNLTVLFKKGESYSLKDEEVSVVEGVSNQSGKDNKVFDKESGDGFPYQVFEVKASDDVDKTGKVRINWEGKTNNEKTKLYVLNTESNTWDLVKNDKSTENDLTTIKAMVDADKYVNDENTVKIMVQNGEGYTPEQFEEGAEAKKPQFDHITTSHKDDKPRDQYDFTFAVETDTQYYNEDVPTNPSIIGKYQYQLDIHDWLISNRPRLNLQYLFHTGDIIDDEYIVEEWHNADKAYKMLDDDNLPYGVLAGNHDVHHKSSDYTSYGKFFGEDRFNTKPYYGESFENNRGHYDLITVDGIDFIMLYMGWDINENHIEWMNNVLRRYPERKAILNFHEYLLASGGFGEQPQMIHDKVVQTNPNVIMVLSGHYHNAKTVELPIDDDGDGNPDRVVQQMLFDYQGLKEGGMGYIRLMHWDNENREVHIKTYSPTLNDYNAKDETGINSESLKELEDFIIPYDKLGITPKIKELSTNNLTVNFDSEEVIARKDNVKSGDTVKVSPNEKLDPQTFDWYAEVIDEFGGMHRSDIQTLTIVKTEEDVEENPEQPGEASGETEGETGEEPGETSEETESETDKEPGDTSGETEGETDKEPGETSGETEGETDKEPGETSEETEGETSKEPGGTSNQPGESPDKSAPKTGDVFIEMFMIATVFAAVAIFVVKKRKEDYHK